MDNLAKKVVVNISQDKTPNECISLLETNGFEVEFYTEGIPSPMQLFHLETFPNRDKQLVHKTCQYLAENIVNKLALDDVAVSMGSNRSQLAAAFKRTLGIGVFEWLRNQRMQRAKQLLKYSDLSIQEIGFEVGYPNSANFSSAYKKRFHMSPRQQRNKSKAKLFTHSKELLT